MKAQYYLNPAVRILSYAIMVVLLWMGWLIYHAPQEMAPLFDYALDVAAPKVWGGIFGGCGLALLISHLVGKGLYTTHYVASFVFLSWGSTMLLSSLSSAAFTSGYPQVAILAGISCITVANCLSDHIRLKKGR
jgi:hypothetical protein